jgi:serine/threonine protein kinase
MSDPAADVAPLAPGVFTWPSPEAGSETLLRIPDYDLVRRVGAGAYGEVWLARSTATGVLRAAKIVWRRTFEDDRPFEREFEGIQRFEEMSREHPSQLALFHIGRNDAEVYFYYIMELADRVGAQSPESKVQRLAAFPGPESGSVVGVGDSYTPHTLRADLARGRLPSARVLEIGLALTEALGHLQKHGLVHRDMKPSNVIFVSGRPKLADIGLVTDASDTCSIVGTEGYLPPEGPGTPQADLFALGKVLYEAANGLDRREFPKLPEDARSWSDAKLLFELNEAILKACAAAVGKRYGSAELLHADLELLGAGKSIRRAQRRQGYWQLDWIDLAGCRGIHES